MVLHVEIDQIVDNEVLACHRRLGHLRRAIEYLRVIELSRRLGYGIVTRIASLGLGPRDQPDNTAVVHADRCRAAVAARNGEIVAVDRGNPHHLVVSAECEDVVNDKLSAVIDGYRRVGGENRVVEGIDRRLDNIFEPLVLVSLRLPDDRDDRQQVVLPLRDNLEGLREIAGHVREII